MTDRCVIHYSIFILLVPPGQVLETLGGPRGEIGWHGKSGSGRAIIGGKKPSEGKKSSEHGKGQLFGQLGSRQQGSMGSPMKIGVGNIGECFARDGMRRRTREATAHRTEESETDGRKEDRF